MLSIYIYIYKSIYIYVCKVPAGALRPAAALNPAMQRGSSKDPQEMGENDVAGGSPEGHLQNTALVGELVPSQQK